MVSAVVTCDLQNRIIGWSETAGFDYAASELLGNQIARVVPELANGVGIAARRKPGTPVSATWVGRNGVRLPVTLHAQPVPDVRGNTLACCYVIQARDEAGRAPQSVTAMVEAGRREDQIHTERESQRRLQELMECLPQLVWTCDPAGSCDFLSQRWLDYTGVPLALQIGSGWLAQVHPEDRSGLQAAWRRSVETGTEFALEFRLLRNDGIYRWFDTRARPLHGEHGEILKWFGSNTDIHEAREARQALRESEQRLREFSEHIDGVLWIRDPCEPRTLYASPAYARLWQRPVERLYECSDTWLDGVHPEDRERVSREYFTKAGCGGFDCEYRVLRQDGSQIWIRDRGVPVRGEHGELLRIVGFAQDITQRKNTERMLRQWADAFQHCAHGIGMADPDQDTIRVCNPALARILGRSVEEVTGMPVRAVYPLAEGAKAEERWRSADAQGQIRFESVMLRPDGTQVPVEVALVSVRDGERVLYRIATVQDMSERKRAEEQLRVARSHLESAVEAASLGVWVWDIDSNTMWGNEMQRRLWGITVSPLHPRSAQDNGALIHEDDRERTLSELRQCATVGTRLVTEFRVRRQNDGQVRWIAARASPELDVEGRPVRVVGVNLDITEQKLASEALLRSQKLEALGTLAGGIAHDFNNILQAVIGYAELSQLQLSKDLPADHVSREHLREIATAANRAAGLVRQILAFSRPQEPKRRPIELAPIVGEAMQLLRATISTSVAIKCDVAKSLPLVSADPIQIHQVLVNLVTNAAHAIGRAPGLVEIQAQPVELDSPGDRQTPGLATGSYVELAVRDDGCGMDKETLARIFDPFFSTKALGQGTGLGLSVVHGIMRSLGGAVAAWSEPGRGSLFRLYFPIDPREPAPAELSPIAAQGHGQRILFIDDERALVALGRQTLERFGYVAEAFDDPALALSAFRERTEAYAAVVTDLAMPGMTGFEVATAVLSVRPDLPVLLMSGYIGAEERARASHIGIRALLGKPMSMDSLAGQLAAVLQGGGEQPAREEPVRSRAD